MTGIPAYLLAGGGSTRFGRDKARVEVDGEPLIRHAALPLQPFAPSITVVADVPDKYQDLGYATIADTEPGLGPIGGLITALEHAGDAEWVLISSCDWLRLKPRWVQLLLQARVDGVDAVAFRDDRWQPLPGVYRPVVGEIARILVDRDTRALHSVLSEVRTRPLDLPSSWSEAARINTPDDLIDAMRWRPPPPDPDRPAG